MKKAVVAVIAAVVAAVGLATPAQAAQPTGYQQYKRMYAYADTLMYQATRAEYETICGAWRQNRSAVIKVFRKWYQSDGYGWISWADSRDAVRAVMYRWECHIPLND